ncbi:MAG: hypothetical protein KatS3mg057_1953 [Herpetosiphonaceae bacterium]|nr:MAG: hypothetical protein KatS3mg057_1953 [Herpetosiphonaceae bacterium]
MPEFLYDLHPVSHITTGAVGVPGQRTFYIQAQQGEQLVTLIAEKEQVRTLSESIRQLLAEIAAQGRALPKQSEEPTPAEMALREPLDPLFRIAQLGLGYDAEQDLIVLVAQELLVEEGEEDEFLSDELPEVSRPDHEPHLVRFWATRAQMQAFSRQGLSAVSAGRPLCPQCLQPMDASGHFCIKKNGHAGVSQA